MSPFLRPLFKPILDKASRAAYKMKPTMDAVGANIYNSPYYKNYMDAARGNQGRVKQAVAVGTPIYAYNKTTDLFRTTDPASVEQPPIQEDTKTDDSSITTFPDIQQDDTETVDQSTDINEETLTDDDNVSDTVTTDQALVEQSNLYAGLIDNDSLTRIEGYKDVIRQFMDTGDEGQDMQNMALLMQLGSALMSGKSMDTGLGGFIDIVGQAGMATAPTLFQMGVEKGKAEREISAAALNLYMDQMDKQNDRSGPFTVVYENIYKTDKDGGLVYDSAGDPIVVDKQRVGTFYRTSPEINQYMDINGAFGYDRFTFIDTSASKEGIDIASGAGGEAGFRSKAAMDDQVKYAKYVKRTLDTMADYIMPLIIGQKDVLTGFWGGVGELAAPKKALLDAINDGLFTGNGALNSEDFNKQLGNINNDLVQDMVNDNYIVFETPTYTQVIDGQEVGFFVDTGNKYGFNTNPVYAADGKTLIDAGEPAYIPTKRGIDMLLSNPNRSALKTFETTLGLTLARNRQPTGRMLADVLRRSFEETKMTGLGSDLATSPYQVINNYTYIFNELNRNMQEALRSSGFTDDVNVGNEKGYTYSPDSFKIKGMDKYVASYYGLREQDSRYIHDIQGGPVFGAWKQSMGGNIQMNEKEDIGNINDIHNNIMQELE